MSAQLGVIVIKILESAGEHHLGDAAPGTFASFLLQIGGSNALRAYDGSATYWERVQVVLDNYFDSAQRAEVCARLVARAELRGRPEFQGFLARALAECRLQELIAAAALAASALGPAVAPIRRPR